MLKTQEKFYLADASLKYCMMGFHTKSVAAMLENIVYFELRRKGYEVYIGKNETKEIDFVAVRREDRAFGGAATSSTEYPLLPRILSSSTAKSSSRSLSIFSLRL